MFEEIHFTYVYYSEEKCSIDIQQLRFTISNWIDLLKLRELIGKIHTNWTNDNRKMFECDRIKRIFDLDLLLV